MYCVKCGAELVQDSKFCSKCGTSTDSQANKAGSGQADNMSQRFEKFGKLAADKAKIISNMAGEKITEYTPVVKKKLSEISQDISTQAKEINDARREAIHETASVGNDNKAERYKATAKSFFSRLSTKQINILIGLVLFGIAALYYLFSSTSIDDLSPQEATRAVGVCAAYHSAVKQDLDEISKKVSTLMVKPNVRGNLVSVGQDWIGRYSLASSDSKPALINEAKKECRLAGLPY